MHAQALLSVSQPSSIDLKVDYVKTQLTSTEKSSIVGYASDHKRRPSTRGNQLLRKNEERQLHCGACTNHHL